jgi:hypothetical protein
MSLVRLGLWLASSFPVWANRESSLNIMFIAMSKVPCYVLLIRHLQQPFSLLLLFLFGFACYSCWERQASDYIFGFSEIRVNVGNIYAKAWNLVITVGVISVLIIVTLMIWSKPSSFLSLPDISRVLPGNHFIVAFVVYWIQAEACKRCLPVL